MGVLTFKFTKYHKGMKKAKKKGAFSG